MANDNTSSAVAFPPLHQVVADRSKRDIYMFVRTFWGAICNQGLEAHWRHDHSNHLARLVSCPVMPRRRGRGWQGGIAGAVQSI
jgi:hypothetical protein